MSNHHMVNTFISVFDNDVNEIFSTKIRLPKDILTTNVKQALQQLHNTTDIGITKADNGGAILIQNVVVSVQEAKR